MLTDFESRLNYQSPALETVKLFFGSNNTEFVNADMKGFKPEMVYQIFGNSETIYGYKDLQVNICFCTSNGRSYVDIKYSDIADFDERRGLKPDDVLSLLEPWFPQGFTTDKDTFLAETVLFNNETFGHCINKFSYPIPNGENTMFVINVCNIFEPGFKDFHQRFEPILIFYIEGANFIDMEDDKWSVVYIYEEKSVGDQFAYTLAGMCTMYNFYKNPYSNRCRISQMMILPSYQKLGLGTHLLTTIYSMFNHSIPNIRELTVESPNNKFTKIRDKLDCKLLIELGSFNKENVKAGLTQYMMREALIRAKINKTQCRKVYGILRMLYTNMEDEQDVLLLKSDMKKQFHSDLVRDYHRCMKRGACEDKIEKFEILLNVPELHESYLERQYAAYYHSTKSLVEQLKHYPYVQPRKPMQLLLQRF